jgi:hypothetical protein
MSYFLAFAVDAEAQIGANFFRQQTKYMRSKLRSLNKNREIVS